MSMGQLLASGCAAVFNPGMFLMVCVAIILGTIFGALPGVSATMAVALGLTFTYTMEPIPAIVFLVAIYCSSITGGSITAILFKIPGVPSSAPTTFDGYPMAQRGEAGKALGVALLASAIGGLTIPAMKKEGYPAPFAVAVSSISSILGPIIPPSITLIVYASITNVSVSQLFMGSVIPGILLAGSLIVYALVYGKRKNLPAHEKQTPKQIGHAFKEGIWALLMPIIILGGIFGGIFTPTEAAAVAVVYALIISLTVYRDMKLSELPQVFVEASVSTATIMMMVGLSKASSYVVVTSGLPQQLLDVFTSITSNRIVILLLLNLLFLIIGMLMEANAAIIMMTPILTPLLTAFNIDALQFGIVMSFNLCIGLVTPPVGLCLLICNQIAKTRLMKALKAMMPMLLISVIVLMLITYIPVLTTWLPSMIKT